MESREKAPRWFSSMLDLGKIGRIIAAAGAVGWVGLQGYEDMQRQLIDTRAAIHELAVEVHSSLGVRDDHTQALKDQIELRFTSLSARVAQIESRQDDNEHRSRDTESTLAAIKEQSAATYAAVSQLQAALMPQRRPN